MCLGAVLGVGAAAAGASGGIGTVLSVAKGILGVFSAIQGAQAANAQAKAASQAAAFNAQTARIEADREHQRGRAEEDKKKKEIARLAGIQTARAGASGAVVSGSALRLIEDDAAEGEQDVLQIRDNRDYAVNARLRQAGLHDAEAKNHAASKTSVGLAALGPAISLGGQVSSAWSEWQGSTWTNPDDGSLWAV